MQTLFVAQKLGKKTAMFGQGIGPLESSKLIKGTKKVFSNLNVLGVREGLHSPRYFDFLGVSKKNLFVTGDDAIELALNFEDEQSKQNIIGVNIRYADYAGNFGSKLSKVSEVINKISKVTNAEVIPIPISFAKLADDLEILFDVFDFNEEEQKIAKNIDNTKALIKQINRCKVVITGSYHAGVFSLSKGIPIIALVGSKYYEFKFSGLSYQFGEGCTIIKYSSKNFEKVLYETVINSISSGKDIKHNLISRANQQLKINKKAWDILFDPIN